MALIVRGNANDTLYPGMDSAKFSERIAAETRRIIAAEPRTGIDAQDMPKTIAPATTRATDISEKGRGRRSCLTVNICPPLHFWDRAPFSLLQTEERAAGQHKSRQRSNKQEDTLHGEKTPFLALGSPPIPLVMEERCPLRSIDG
jgi:hypothetical protein